MTQFYVAVACLLGAFVALALSLVTSHTPHVSKLSTACRVLCGLSAILVLTS